MNTLNCFQSKGGPRVYILLGALSLLAACSGGGSSASLSSGSGATLSDSKSSLEVPAGSFEDNISVTLNENQADTKDVGNAQVISNPVTLEFSKARIAQSTDPISLKIQLDTEQMRQALADGKGIYAKVRVRGEQISYDTSAADEERWVPLLGELDAGNGTLTIRLYASAAVVDVVGVAGTELKVAAMDAAAFNRSKAVKKVGSKAVNTIGMGQYPWAVVCDTDKLSDHGAHTCDANDPNSLVRKIQDGMTDASRELLNHLGMNTLVMQQLTALSLGQTNLSTLPDPAVLRRHDPSVKYNMVYLTSGATSNFTTATGILKIVETQASNDAYTLAVGNVYHHELVHAVQSAICNNCASIDDRVNLNRNSPLSEGTATAVGMLASVNWNTGAVRGKLLSGVPRNWILTLAHYNPYADSYFMTEFFTLANNGDLNYLMPLFRAFNGNDNGVFNRRLDAAVTAALGKSLGEVYMTRVMPQRASSSPAGIYYNVYDVTNNDISHRWEQTVSAMGTDQYLFTVSGDDDVCINVHLDEGVNQNLALVALNGTEGGSSFAYGEDSSARYTTNGDTLVIQGRSADVQVVNVSPGGVADNKTYTIEVHTDGACLPPPPEQPCNPMKVVCGERGCNLYVQDFAGICWAKAAGCDAQGRCTRQGFEGGFDFGNCEGLRNQMTQNIPVGDATRSDPANVPENHNCGDVDLGCRWIVLCGR